MEKKKRVWLRKWDYTKYPFDRLISDYKKDAVEDLGVNYGLKFDRKEDLKDGSLIQSGDDIYIYFTNIPGLDNQIMLKYENVQTCNKDGEQYYDRIELNNMKEEEIKYQKYCTVKEKTDIKWVIDKDNRFSKEGLINEFGINVNFYTSKDITDNDVLITALNDCLASIKDYAEKYEKIRDCFFLENGLTGSFEKNHDTFRKKDGLTYIERHHFIPQEIYRNASDDVKEKIYNKIYSRDNILFLCPRCHRMIHLGQNSIQEEMIETIMKDANIRKNVEEIASIFKITTKELLDESYKGINIKD